MVLKFMFLDQGAGMQEEKNVTILTDWALKDFPSTRKDFVVIAYPDYRILDFTRGVRQGLIQIDTASVCLSIGNNQVPLQRGENLANKIKKLMMEIKKFKPMTKFYVLSVLPRPDDEDGLTPMVMAANDQLSQAARDMRRQKATPCEYLSTCRLFLERYKYKNNEGEWCVRTRIVRPITRFFQKDSAHLNNVGVEFVKSFLLDRLGISPGSCPWTEPPLVLMSGGSGSEDEDSENSESEKEGDTAASKESASSEDDSEKGGLDSSPGSPGQFISELSPERIKVQLSQKPGRVMGLVKSWEARVAQGVNVEDGGVKRKAQVALEQTAKKERMVDTDSDLDGSTVVPIGSDELDL